MINAKIVGIKRDGGLVIINSSGEAQGYTLRGMIVSARYTEWFEAHEDTFRACFSWKRPEDRENDVIFLDRE